MGRSSHLRRSRSSPRPIENAIKTIRRGAAASVSDRRDVDIRLGRRFLDFLPAGLRASARACGSAKAVRGPLAPHGPEESFPVGVGLAVDRPLVALAARADLRFGIVV